MGGGEGRGIGYRRTGQAQCRQRKRGRDVKQFMEGKIERSGWMEL